MLTYCPKCRRILTQEQFESYEECPSCHQDFNRMHYGVATFLSLVFGGGIWFLALRFPKDQWGLAWAISTGMTVFWFFEVVVDIWIKRRTGIPKALRRRILAWTATILGLVSGCLVKVLFY